jgi:serine/threonine-protein kinase
MDAFADALLADPSKRPPSRVRYAVLGAVAVLAVAVVAVRGRALEDPCAHPERQLAGAWDEPARSRVRAAFVGTGRSYAGDTATRVARLLDEYAASWARMRGDVCQASRRGTLRREVVDRRDECLDRRLGQVGALAAVLGEKPDAQVLDKAVSAVAALPPIASCADVEALTARVRPPEDPALRARVAALEPRVDQMEALYKAGRYKEGVALGEAAIAEAKAAAHAPLTARAHLSMGELRTASGDYEGAKVAYRDGAAAAAEGRDDVLAATAWARVLFVLGERQRRLDEAGAVRSFGPTMLARVHDERAELTWLNAEGLFLMRKGHYDEARATDERALALGEKVLGPDHLDVASTLNNLGVVFTEMGDPVRAKGVVERALAIRERALGPDHPQVGTTLINLGRALSATGDPSGARAIYERALALYERAVGPDHPMVALALNNLGGMLIYVGAWTEARAAYERAIAIREKALGLEHPDVAQSLHGRGTVLRLLGYLADSAVALRRSRAISEKALGPDHPDVAYSLGGLARTLVRLGEFEEASLLLDRALALREKAGGPANPASVEPLLGLGELKLARGKPEEAAPFLERALALHDPEADTDIELTLAEALVKIGKDVGRARALAEHARASYERAGHRPGAERAARWLADHAR